jgi:CrcB protein
MSPLIWLGVAATGGLGAVLRFVVDGGVSARAGRGFPYGTLAVGTGAVGAYTTFSTWMFETQRLGEDRQLGRLLANVVVSVLAGLLAAAIGEAMGAAL